MESRDLLKDAFERIHQIVHRVATDLDPRMLTARPDPAANSIAWLIWHLTRAQDSQVSEIADQQQAWMADGWAERFGMPPDPTDTGYGHTSEQVGAVRPEGPELLLEYHDAVTRRTLAYLETVDPEELNRIIDRSYDPPVSVGVRLVSVISDDLQHAGQAAYLRGMLERTTT